MNKLVLYVIIAIVTLSVSATTAICQNFCEPPFGIEFYSSRKQSEDKMLTYILDQNKDMRSMKRFDAVTIFFMTSNKSYGLFFDNNKLVGVSILFATPFDKQNADIIYNTFMDMKKTIDEEKDWKFSKTFEDNNSTPQVRGMIYECRKNKKEIIAISLTKDTNLEVIGIDLFHHLKGHNLREF
jgi:hypothetical protein